MMYLDACNISSPITLWWQAYNSPQCCFFCLFSVYWLVFHSSLTHLMACLLFQLLQPLRLLFMCPFEGSSSFTHCLLKTAPHYLTKVWGTTWLFQDGQGELGTLTCHKFSRDCHLKRAVLLSQFPEVRIYGWKRSYYLLYLKKNKK